jgi:hypothetical protein
MEKNGTEPARWLLVVGPNQWDLFEILHERLAGSGVDVVVERRTRERRRGSLGPAMDRRSKERRRQRPVAHVSVLVPSEAAERAPTVESPKARANGAGSGLVTHPCPKCASSVELDLPRFPHPPARVEMEVAHVTGNNRRAQHYVEIAAFTVSGRLILSQRVPARMAS